jgi:hypothetical protein
VGEMKVASIFVARNFFAGPHFADCMGELSVSAQHNDPIPIGIDM